jgi:hypothetical protein
MIPEIVSVISVLIASAALGIAVWQGRENSKSSAIMNSSPIAADIWAEWRSEDFRQHMLSVVADPEKAQKAGEIESLPRDYRQSAYAVIYYFNQVGTLVAFGLVSENLVIGVLGGWIMRTWRVLEPVIAKERERRVGIYPPDTPPNFSDYYEHLVQRVLDLGGSEAMNMIQGQIQLRHLSRPVTQVGLPERNSN